MLENKETQALGCC